jgi:prophage tail gpP-like protein
MAFELIRVAADGVLYEGWESIQISWERGRPVIQFVLTTTEIGPPGVVPAFDKWNFPPGTQIDVFAGNDLLISGFVLNYAPTYDADQHSIVVTGVTGGYIFGYSSVDPVKFQEGRFDKITDSELAQRFAGAACTSIQDYTTPDLLPWFQIRQGATYYQEMMRIYQQRGKTIMATRTGGMAVVDESSWFMNVQASLVQGLNILKASASLDALRNQDLFVKGQNPIGTNLSEHIQPEASLLAGGGMSCVKRVIVDQAVTTKTLAMRRVLWEAMRVNYAKMQAVITTPGWRHQGGGFWSVNEGVYVLSPWLQIDCTMAIWKVVYTQNDKVGTITEITLVNPAGTPIQDPSSDQFIPGAQNWECNSGSVWHEWVPGAGLGSPRVPQAQ